MPGGHGGWIQGGDVDAWYLGLTEYAVAAPRQNGMQRAGPLKESI